jgi:signal transduction histidine kinase
MDTLSPLILLHENGYKALAPSKGGDGLGRVVPELQGKIGRVGRGDLDVKVSFADRNDSIGDLGRSFNDMVQQLHESREETERQHRTQMSRAEHLATLTELAAGFAHEIRNPLAGIAGVIEIVERDLPTTSPAIAVVKDVRLEIARIDRILGDLLQAAHPHLTRVCPSDLNTTVEHAVVRSRLQVLSRPIAIKLFKDPNLPNVEHDVDQIHQLLLNLLLNAVQAIEGVGEIRVEVSLLKDFAAVAVSDTGRGIAPEHLSNIFLPFYTTKENGTGLGLSLARGIAAGHHGRIDVTSEAGKGTKFLVVLPLQQGTAQAAAS